MERKADITRGWDGGACRRMMAGSPAVQLVIDGRGAILDANPAAVAFYGHPVARLRRMTVFALDVAARTDTAETLRCAGTGHGARLVRRHRLASGERRDVEVFAASMIVAGRRLLHCIVHDVTAARRIEDALRESEARFRDIVAAASDWFWETDADLRFSYVSDRFFDLMRIPREAVLGRDRKEVIGDSLRRTAPELWARHCDDLDGRRPFRDLDLPIIGRDGRRRHIRTSGVPVFGADGAFRGYRGSGTDVTELKDAEEELRRLATTDGLTGVDNRRQFMERAAAEFARSQRFGHPFAVVLVDLDHFKRVNDTHGHAAGDAVLRHFAALCRRDVRGIDLVGRLGGEEFAIALIETDAAGALDLAERLRLSAAEAPVLFGEGVIPFTASFGVAAAGPGDGSVEELLGRADRALYVAKNGGRNAVVLAERPDVQDRPVRPAQAVVERQGLSPVGDDAEKPGGGSWRP